MAAGHLQPARVLAHAATLAAAEHALDVHLGRGLGEREVRRAETDAELALEEALEEADFFVSQGLLDDALSLLEEQIPRYPGHPLLIERMQSVRAAKRG